MRRHPMSIQHPVSDGLSFRVHSLRFGWLSTWQRYLCLFILFRVCCFILWLSATITIHTPKVYGNIQCLPAQIMMTTRWAMKYFSFSTLSQCGWSSIQEPRLFFPSTAYYSTSQLYIIRSHHPSTNSFLRAYHDSRLNFMEKKKEKRIAWLKRTNRVSKWRRWRRWRWRQQKRQQKHQR